MFSQMLNIQSIFKRYAQAGLSLCWSHIPQCWKSYVAAHYDVFLSKKIVFIVATSVDPDFMSSLFTFSHLAQILPVYDDLIELRLKVCQQYFSYVWTPP